MAVAQRSVGQSPGADSTSCVIVKPVGLEVGDLMVAQVVGGRNDPMGAHTAPANWTEIRQDATVDAVLMLRTSLWWKIADSDDVAASNFTFTATDAESNRGTITAWTGHDAATPINANNGQFNTASTTVTSPGITPSVANCMICLFCGINDNNTQSGYAIVTDNPASWSEAYDLPSDLTRDLGLSLGYALRPETSATGNGTATTSGSDWSTGQLIAIAPEAGVTHELTLTDGIGIGESLSKTTSRILSDGIGTGEALAKSMTKILADGIGIGEIWAGYKAQVRTLIDGIGVGEALQRTVSKVITDGVGIGETLSKTLTRILSDSIGVGEALTKTFSKVLSDGIGVSEALTKTFSKVLSDGIGVGEDLWEIWVHKAVRISSYIRNLLSKRNLPPLR
ncbi:MAG: hypothetical protein KKD77_22740 [Gammaproteobacteria bacterium]|nr:hypothetical protein [Gammaproteobacteria bacterium]